MNKRRFLIGSGYYDGPSCGAEWFYPIWARNTIHYLPEQYATHVVVLAVGGTFPAFECHQIHLIRCLGNLGHVGQLLSGEKHHAYCGWTSAVLTLAMLAYTNESDFIYKEQDCLAFGPWIDKLYEEIGTAGMIFGNCKLMPAAQSLFMVKHDYIPRFVRRMLSGEPERTDAWVPEHKFKRMESESPDKVKRFSFGYDRDRPFNVNDEVFYVQKLTRDELAQLHTAGLINIGDPERMPECKVFSNTE